MYFGVFLVILRYFRAFLVIFGVIWYVYGLGHFGVQLVGGACIKRWGSCKNMAYLIFSRARFQEEPARMALARATQQTAHQHNHQ